MHHKDCVYLKSGDGCQLMPIMVALVLSAGQAEVQVCSSLRSAEGSCEGYRALADSKQKTPALMNGKSTVVVVDALKLRSEIAKFSPPHLSSRRQILSNKAGGADIIRARSLIQ
jgi:hypothetical protein